MASVLQQYSQLADFTATQITGSYQSWTDFLTTAARLYKYPYHEQLMIYAQRPDATACADYELWNKRMGRYVRRGAKGIALIDHSGDAPKLKYVFDVADTRTTERSYHLNLEVRLHNGAMKTFEFDVTDQVKAQPRGGVIIVSDGLVITDEEGAAGSDSGFDIDVEGWGDYIDIPLPL